MGITILVMCFLNLCASCALTILVAKLWERQAAVNQTSCVERAIHLNRAADIELKANAAARDIERKADLAAEVIAMKAAEASDMLEQKAAVVASGGIASQTLRGAV